MDTLDRLAAAALPFAWAWFLLLMTLRTAVILRRGYRVDLGRARGSARRGVLYSLSFSLLPWKKDSSRRHPWTYLAGMGMHLGLFLTMLFALGLRLWTWPAWMAAPVAAAAGIGWVSALGLLVKRAVKPSMRSISSPDDYVSNLLVQGYLLGGGLAAVQPAFGGLWRLGAVLVLVYVPLGKIYHMVLFFVSRVLFGLRFGRRGVLQHDVPVSY